MKLNKDHQFLLANGFDVEIRSSGDGFAKMYLLKNGERARPLISIMFRDNKQSRDVINERVSKARNFTHLGVALKRMKDVVQDEYKL